MPKWKDLSPEEKEQVRARQRQFAKERQRAKVKVDRLRSMRPGDYVRCKNAPYNSPTLAGKIVRFVEWADDDPGKTRRLSLRQIIIEVEPHRTDTPRTARCQLGQVYPVNGMEVLADAVRSEES